MKTTPLLLVFALVGAVAAFAAPPESPFATPLTAEEAAEGTGLETATPPEQWIPPEYGLKLGMGKLRARLARWGLQHDEEASAADRYCLSQRLSEKDGRGDIGLTFEDGKLVLFDVNWSFDDGWSADEPGAVRDRLDAALRRLGPPTRRWVRERTLHFEENNSDETWIWYVWAWRQGELEAFFEIRRSASSPSDRYLRASFCAGAVRRLAPDIPEWLGEPTGDAPAPDAAHWADFSAPIRPGWQLGKPFANENCETLPGFLVVEKVKDHPTIRGSGVEVGDICLSWGTLDPEPPETLREAWLAFLVYEANDEDEFWFARDRDGKTEVFSCGMVELFECMVALGTFGLELRPVPFKKEDAERILAAAAARKAANMAERGELRTLSPPLQEEVEALE